MPPLKVLFIAGFGRSGTTLLDSILGQLDGFVSVGESQYLWDRAYRDDRLCGCGETFHSCPFWRPIAAGTLADLAEDDIEAMVALRDRLGPWRSLRASRRGTQSPEIQAYVDRLGRVYAAVAAASGSRVIVDSSKSPSHGWLLGQLDDVELHVVHMVRDPRAVAYSWRKKMVYDDSKDEPMYMARLSLRRSSWYWMSWNWAIERLFAGRGDRYRLLPYERFVAAPRRVVEEIVDGLGESSELPFDEEGRAVLEPVHSVAGNPNRFQSGPVAIRRDDAWRAKLGDGPRRIVSLLTWPLRGRYGY